MFHPELHGSLSMFRAILKGEKLKQIPNNSMSFIDVRDLAQLELAALENNNARGNITIATYLHNRRNNNSESLDLIDDDS